MGRFALLLQSADLKGGAPAESVYSMEVFSRKRAMLPQRVSTNAGRVRLGLITLIAASAAGGIVAAFGLVPGTTLDTVATERIVRELPLPAVVQSAVQDRFWREERVRRGDTLGQMLARLGADDPDAWKFLHTNASARALYQLRPGKALRLATDEDGRMLALRYLLPGGDQLTIDRAGEDFLARTIAPQSDVRLVLRSSEINSSLFAAADAVGLPDAITMQLADVFSGDIDFHHDLRRGDRFAVVYEIRYVGGEPIGAGRIVAAEFVNKGTARRAFLWRDADGSDGYYAQDGKSLRKAFLRSPLAFTRITSGFSLARFHPFLQTWRAHKGVDFAAPTGTPVRAAGDGKIALVTRQTGYGNVVAVKHNGAYSTLYAHLSRFAAGLRVGANVRQGEVIGYVGQTGWATGPHLHYEFRVDNVQRDPLTIALPNAQPIAASELTAYAAQVSPLAAELALGRSFVLAGGE
jgi:murein DD-endopeptidase MepM/ murein hydrolase activator NlpD